MKQIFYLILVILVLPASVKMLSGDAKPLPLNPPDAPLFQRFNDQDGLSQNTVNSILQDSKGFLWIGTENGLNRFDGYQFYVYRHNFQDRKSISGDSISLIYETKSGEI